MDPGVSAEAQRFVDRGFSNAGHVRSAPQDGGGAPGPKGKPGANKK